jgi:predicted small lipoprotein YifL
MRVPILVLVLTAYLAGCGYKGPLFMPKPGSQAKRPGSLVTPEPPPDRPLPAEAAPQPK